jgi:hypothetical protein
MKEEIERSTWEVEDTLFSLNKLPEKYKNESAVILAKRETISLEKKGTRIPLVLFTADGRSLLTQKIVREKIYINDQFSLKEFSEIQFSQIISKRNGFAISNLEYSFIGLRIIKPDGTIKKINVEEQSVELNYNKNVKEKKIAIPDLAIGDVLDYYICLFEKSTYSNSPSGWEEIIISSNYPIIKYLCSIEIDKNYGAWLFRTNDSPEFTQSYNKDKKTTVLSFFKENINKVNSALWNSPLREEQKITLYKSINNIYFSTNVLFLPGHIFDFTNDIESLKDRQESALNNIVANADRSKIYEKTIKFSDFENAVEDQTKLVYNKKTKDVSTEKLLNVAIPVFRNVYFVNGLFTKVLSKEDKVREYLFTRLQNEIVYEWTCILNKFCKKHKIESKIFIAEDRQNYKLSNTLDIVGSSKILLQIKYNGIMRNISLENGIMTWDILPKDIDGNNAKIFDEKKYAFLDLSMSGDHSIIKQKIIENQEINNYKIEFEQNDFLKTLVKRSLVAKGQNKILKQSQLELIQTYVEENLKELKKSESVLDFYSAIDKENINNSLEFQNYLKKEKSVQKKMFTDEAKEQFDNQLKEIKSFTITKHGLQTKDTTFEMEEELVLDGLVKNAGSNYIFDFGKLLGPQIEVKPAAHTRKENVYMPYPRQYIYNIQFNIPDEFTCEGVEKLNVKVENETGGFVSIATVKGNLLNVDIKKYYSNGYEPVANWPKMTAFLDACFEFTKVKVLLKKK